MCGLLLCVSICLWMNRYVQVCACINVGGCVSEHMSTGMMVYAFTKPCMHLYPHLGAADTTNLHPSPPHHTKESLSLSSCLELCPPSVWNGIIQQHCFLSICSLPLLNNKLMIKIHLPLVCEHLAKSDLTYLWLPIFWKKSVTNLLII